MYASQRKNKILSDRVRWSKKVNESDNLVSLTIEGLPHVAIPVSRHDLEHAVNELGSVDI